MEGEFWERPGFKGYLTRFWGAPLMNQAAILAMSTLFRLFKTGVSISPVKHAFSPGGGRIGGFFLFLRGPVQVPVG